MKTLKELNSKWYWRLIKVTYILFALFIFWVSCVLISESVRVFNPKTIAEVKTKYEGWTTKIQQIETDYPGEMITRSEISKKAKNPKSVIRALFALEKNIEWIFLIENNPIKINDAECDNDLDDYLNSLTTNIAINSHLCNIEWLKVFFSRIKQINPNWEKNESDISDVYNLFYSQTYLYKDYLWPKQIFEIVIYSFWILIGILLFTIIIRAILFYILFWNVFMKE